MLSLSGAARSDSFFKSPKMVSQCIILSPASLLRAIIFLINSLANSLRSIAYLGVLVFLSLAVDYAVAGSSKKWK